MFPILLPISSLITTSLFSVSVVLFCFVLFIVFFSRGFQVALVVKISPNNARDMRCRFDPWVGKIPWRWKWQHTPVFSSGDSNGQRSLLGCSPWGCIESNTILFFRFSILVKSYGICFLCVYYLLSMIPTRSTQYLKGNSVQFILSVMSDCDSRDCSMPGFVSIANSRSLLKLKSIKSVMPSNHLILCHPFFSCLQWFSASGGQTVEASASSSDHHHQWLFRTDFL